MMGMFYQHGSLLAHKSLLALSALLLGSVVIAAEPNSPDEPRAQVANWALSDPHGQQIDFYQHAEGAPSVLFFWATWCPYCKALIPHLKRFREEQGLAKMKYYALNVWEDGDPVRYLKEKGLDFHLLLDADDVAKRYGVKGTPGVILVNAQKEILYRRVSGAAPEQVISDMKVALENQGLR